MKTKKKTKKVTSEKEETPKDDEKDDAAGAEKEGAKAAEKGTPAKKEKKASTGGGGGSGWGRFGFSPPKKEARTGSITLTKPETIVVSKQRPAPTLALSLVPAGDLSLSLFQQPRETEYFLSQATAGTNLTADAHAKTRFGRVVSVCQVEGTCGSSEPVGTLLLLLLSLSSCFRCYRVFPRQFALDI